MRKTNTPDNEALRGKGTSRFVSFFQFPLAWMLVGALGIILANVAFNLLSKDLKALGSIILALAGSAVAIVIYWFVMKFLARRPVPELLFQRRAVSEVLFGAVVGFTFIIASTAIIVLCDGYSFKWANENASSVVWPIITTSLGAAFVEELIFRGLAFQAIEKMGGSWLALTLTSLFFGIAHLGNPGATVWGGLSIAIEAGVLLGAAFLWRRNIWFIISLHFFWNTIEGLLGIPVSGHPTPGLFTVEVTGPTLLTGGEFGLEASIIPVIISLLIAVPMLIFARGKGHLMFLRQGPK
ncbi:CPBP family intramembrane glutamic endopeptidase [Paenibacillus sp. MMS18-CY102]|uniref:CPBP family intramembrane glutamic endopeptidase n=1 Tax=Paenibacillus sp. MMS18-CY102 TaxID=2682849 RepID=UPI0013660C31|nr:type II CAAX endopeptidase family protein [Paenibacillus sp. MMS18-CY102]MWC29133.1 CPBP family intramembrane metalloprotease [Paenibacillus sp. MMS18-CY102]